MSNHGVKIEFDVPVPMRDGTVLRADLYLPDTDSPAPTVVARTPYDKWNYRAPLLFCDPVRLARNGYAVVAQDCRGCGKSGGEFYPVVHDAQDGYDTIEWAAAQSWSSGRVGMIGGSYLGSMQWMAARARPPHLKAIVPVMAPGSLRDLMFRGGVFQLQSAQQWSTMMAALLARKYVTGEALTKLMTSASSGMEDPRHDRTQLPLNAWCTGLHASFLKFYFDFLLHPDNDDYWRTSETDCSDSTPLPAYIVGGWHDACLEAGMLDNYRRIKEASDEEAFRKHVKLVIGPWVHDPMPTQRSGDIDYGIRASSVAIDMNGSFIRWLDYWLKDSNNGICDDPPVRLFVMGANRWRDEGEWPLARTRFNKYYLRAGDATCSGVLATTPPENELPDSYSYDPRDPVPTRGGRILDSVMGPLDQSAIEARDDVLTYSTMPLTEDLEVTGPISVVLYAQSSAPDTDFTAKLVDVWPTGQAFGLADGIVRARYRAGDQTPLMIDPGTVYEYKIELFAISNVFKTGHRIRLEISSSNFPKYDRNLNTGQAIGSSTDMQVALQQVFHDSVRPSHLLLPVIPN